MNFLVIDCETADARGLRRAGVGRSGGEMFAATLRALEPTCQVDLVTPADADDPCPSTEHLARYDAVFLGGSTLHIGDGSRESERLIDCMRAVFASRTPSFGSCAGLQVAVMAAGGDVGPMEGPPEAGVARAISATTAGREHPLLRGRPPVWDALTIHADEVKRLPDGATLLAGNARSQVHAAEIRHDGGVFWGVQYHPEVSLPDIAAALRRDPAMLVKNGAFASVAAVTAHADVLATLGHEPDRADLAQQLALDGQVIKDAHRRREISNFLTYLVNDDQGAERRG